MKVIFIKNCIYNKEDKYIGDIIDIEDKYDLLIMTSIKCVEEYKEKIVDNKLIEEVIDNKEKSLIKKTMKRMIK